VFCDCWLPRRQDLLGCREDIAGELYGERVHKQPEAVAWQEHEVKQIEGGMCMSVLVCASVCMSVCKCVSVYMFVYVHAWVDRWVGSWVGGCV
jgi:hypothetical protein